MIHRVPQHSQHINGIGMHLNNGLSWWVAKAQYVRYEGQSILVVMDGMELMRIILSGYHLMCEQGSGTGQDRWSNVSARAALMSSPQHCSQEAVMLIGGAICLQLK